MAWDVWGSAVNRNGRRSANPRRDGWRAGTRRGVVLLVAAACTIQLTACLRVSVLPRPPAGHLPAPVAAADEPARSQIAATASTSSGDPAPTVSPTVTPRQFAYLATNTPLPRPTPSPTATIPPPTPAIPRAQVPPTWLAIPAIDLEAPIVPMGWREDGAGGGDVVWDDPGPAVGWLDSSSLPGEGSNVVLAGHHNIQGEVFRDLVDVAPGDQVYLTAGEITYRYLVRERFILPEKHVSEAQKEQNALWIAPTVDERLTMLTCWPYRDNTHRLIVVAVPAPLD